MGAGFAIPGRSERSSSTHDPTLKSYSIVLFLFHVRYDCPTIRLHTEHIECGDTVRRTDLDRLKLAGTSLPKCAVISRVQAA